MAQVKQIRLLLQPIYGNRDLWQYHLKVEVAGKEPFEIVRRFQRDDFQDQFTCMMRCTEEAIRKALKENER